MAKIEKLTQEQWNALPPFRELWYQIGTNTDPADRATAENAISKIYQANNIKKPKFVWCDSPLTANILIHLTQTDAIEALISLIAQEWNFSSQNLQNITSLVKTGFEYELGNLDQVFQDYPAFSLKCLAKNILSDHLLDDQLSNITQTSPPDTATPTISMAVEAWVQKHIKDSKIKETPPNFWGQQDAYWVAFYKFCEEVLGIEYDKTSSERLQWHADITKSCMWIWAFENVCICCERPSTIHIRNDRLHNENGPALSFRDGWNLYAIKGISVPYWFIEEPHRITVEAIEKQTNVELRRIMINIYGQAKYIQDSGATVIHQDEWGTLYRKELPDDEPLMMVKVVNCTPEPDGTFEDYFLRVHPELRPILPDKTLGEPQELTARNAVASTFGKTGREYNPDAET